MKNNIIKQDLILNEIAQLKNSELPPKNIAENRNPVNIICAYSARKNSAKVIPGYSTLKPDTNSLSPSVKSKGALFVSATQQTKYIKANNAKGNKRIP